MGASLPSTESAILCHRVTTAAEKGPIDFKDRTGLGVLFHSYLILAMLTMQTLRAKQTLNFFVTIGKYKSVKTCI